jgi:hypothetical protein
MPEKVNFLISSSVVRGALCANDGASAFVSAPVMLATLDPPGGMMQPKEWGNISVDGETITANDWRSMVSTNQAINLPSTHSPANAVLWVLRGNFDDRSIAVAEAHAAGIVAKEHRIPGRQGEQICLVVDTVKGAPVLDVWRARMTAAGREKGRDGKWAEARRIFLASLAIGMHDVHDVFRIIVADHMDPDARTNKRTIAYGRFADRWAKKHGRTHAALKAALAEVCNDLGVSDEVVMALSAAIGMAKMAEGA